MQPPFTSKSAVGWRVATIDNVTFAAECVIVGRPNILNPTWVLCAELTDEMLPQTTAPERDSGIVTMTVAKKPNNLICLVLLNPRLGQ